MSSDESRSRRETSTPAKDLVDFEFQSYLSDDSTPVSEVEPPVVPVPDKGKPKLEIHLPWIDPEIRKEYASVEIEDEEEGSELQYMGRRRLRRGAYDESQRQDMAHGQSIKRKRDNPDRKFDKSFGEESDFADDDVDDEEEDDFPLQTMNAPRLRNLRSRQNTRVNSRISSAGDDDEYQLADGVSGQQRQLRARTQRGSNGRSRRDDGPDELGQDVDEVDSDEFVVRSDLQPVKKRRKRRLIRANSSNRPDLRDDAIGYEAPRRSGRATQNRVNMADPEELDVDNMAQDYEKSPTAPKILSVREVFQPLKPDESDFQGVHNQICDTCGGGATGSNSKGPLIPCQGCSNSYHKSCLGQRAMRDHLVTKIGPEYFVLQCRYCVKVYQKKDHQAPDHSSCQSCRQEGDSCTPFSTRKTAKQEEQLRIENNGEDPITAIDRQLVNNAQKVLFRCVGCRRAYHVEHLPRPTSRDSMEVDTDNIQVKRDKLLQEYSIEWKCKECVDAPAKIQALVAWRPTSIEEFEDGQSFNDFGHDAIEYLVKWEGKSYVHCTWMPGDWVWGFVHPSMRTSFARRNDGENSLPKFDVAEAIPEEYMIPDIILCVTYNGYRSTSKVADRAAIQKIQKIYVKFTGLGYDSVVWDTPPTPASEYRYEAFVAAYEEYLNGKYFEDENTHKMKERLKDFRTLIFDEEIEYKTQPDTLRGGALMQYQIQGFNWLLYNFRFQRNVILADEMGLGKTVQIVALITSLVLEKPKIWPFLVVVPNATCANWRRELQKWAPELRVVTYYGGKESQGLAYKHELFPDSSGKMKAHVVVMSYESAQDEGTKSRFKSVHWQGLIVDEGQRLKNENNLLYGALRQFNIPFRILLTGTPLQNNKRELFNLLQFIDSTKRASDLDEEYNELTAENIPKLHNLIRPYFLRRTKAATLKFLPPITRVIVPVTMSVLQEKLSKSIMSRNSHLIQAILAKSKTKATERGSLSNILMQLRKCLCHPFLYSEAVEQRVDNAEIEFANLIEASSKLQLLNIMLPKLKEQGHRVLMFSQFLGQLTIMEDFLTGLGMSFLRLDGNMSSLEKQRCIDAYNSPASTVFAMLLSTRAGGVGINLATSDTVIILDPDFNPHQDLQAVSRSHRIGQKNKVLCFQLMTKDSVEEKIMQIGRKKMALDHALIESMDDKEGEAGQDLESILKHGAEALFSDTKIDRIIYDSASVDKLLDRSQTEGGDVDTENRDAETAFSFARIWANDEGIVTSAADAEVDPVLNQSKWESILREREEAARREAEANKEVLGRGGRRRTVVMYAASRAVNGQDDAGGAVDADSASADDEFVNGGSADESEADSISEGGSSKHKKSVDGELAVATSSKKGNITGTTGMTPKKTPRKPAASKKATQTPVKRSNKPKTPSTRSKPPSTKPPITKPPSTKPASSHNGGDGREKQPSPPKIATPPTSKTDKLLSPPPTVKTPRPNPKSPSLGPAQG